MKNFIFSFSLLIILGIKTYAQDLYIPITSFHYKDAYANFNYDSSSPFYYKVDGELQPGYVDMIPYNRNNLGIIYNTKKGFIIGGYYNSYHRLAVLLGKNFYIYKGYPMSATSSLGLFLTGYQKTGMWTNPYYVMPFYSFNLILFDKVILISNHYYVAVGLKFSL